MMPDQCEKSRGRTTAVRPRDASRGMPKPRSSPTPPLRHKLTILARKNYETTRVRPITNRRAVQTGPHQMERAKEGPGQGLGRRSVGNHPPPSGLTHQLMDNLIGKPVNLCSCQTDECLFVHRSELLRYLPQYNTLPTDRRRIIERRPRSDCLPSTKES